MTDDAMLSHDPTKGPTQGWQWDKKINVFSILGLLSAILAWNYALSTRVTVLENSVKQHEAVVAVEINAIRDIDRQLLLQQDKHYMEIIRRLERIEGAHLNNAGGHNQ